MSLEQYSSSCVRCKSYLFPEDDVVYCPICGAPHHRECYQALGHCALEELHGTEQEYSRLKVEAEPEKQPEQKEKEIPQNKVKCEMCGEVYDAAAGRCPKCGMVDLSKTPNASFDFLGGVPGDFDIGGVTAEEAKLFVFSNTHRYIPKFAVLNKKNKISWNWMAFLFPAPWMLSRKMYKSGILLGILEIAASCMLIPLNFELYNLGFSQSGGFMQNMNDLLSILPSLGKAAVALTAIGTMLSIGVSLFSALFGDYMYKNYTVSNIKKIKAESEDKAVDYRKKGGMNLLLFLLGVMLMQYIPNIIALFL